MTLCLWSGWGSPKNGGAGPCKWPGLGGCSQPGGVFVLFFPKLDSGFLRLGRNSALGKEAAVNGHMSQTVMPGKWTEK